MRTKKAEAPQFRDPLSVQVGGSHYADMPSGYQPHQVLQQWLTPEEYRGYVKGTAIAYLARERQKGGTDDIAKAGHTLEIGLNLGMDD
jgi:hypothetical protein